jgi:FlaA1/EpsC-like NDP-sugar epimerase
LVPYEDIDTEFVGLRPVEKLFEEQQYTDENTDPTEHEKIFCFVSEPKNWKKWNLILMV